MEKRVLREIYEWLDLAPKSCLFFHKWTPWRVTEEGGIRHKDRDGDYIVTGKYKFLARNCRLCGDVRLRTEKSGV